MNDILTSILNGISGLSGSALTFAGALAIAGTLAMAILQVIKELTPVRRRYQQKWLVAWFERRANAFNKAVKQIELQDKIKSLLPVDAAGAQTMLVELSTGGEENAFYDLAIEQMVAQINAAAQIALEYPQDYFPLLSILSQGANADDVIRIVTRAIDEEQQTDQRDLDARNRVGHRIQRNLDGVQIALGSRWKLWMQIVAITLTVLFVEIAIVTNVTDYTFSTLVVGVVLGIVGGYLAPVTRDVVAALQSIRKG